MCAVALTVRIVHGFMQKVLMRFRALILEKQNSLENKLTAYSGTLTWIACEQDPGEGEPFSAK